MSAPDVPRRHLAENDAENDDAEEVTCFPLGLNHEFENAVLDDRNDIVDDLLESGVVPNEENFRTACQCGRLNILIKILARGRDLPIRSGFFLAVISGHEHLLRHLFLAGADINLPDDNGYTVLHMARSTGVCQWLLEMGAVQKANVHGNFPIHSAIQRRNPEIVKLLLDHGAEQIANFCGQTPLHIACIYGFLEIVRVLLENGAQQVLNGYETPLHIACKKQEVEIVELLLQHGGTQIPDIQGRMPLSYAQESMNRQLIDLLSPVSLL